MSFGEKAQVVLKEYEVELENQTDIAEVVQAWVQGDCNVIFQEYVNGELNLAQTIDAMYDIYKDYLKISEVAEENEELLAEIMPSALSCINTGSCSFFEGQRYEHCGLSCGLYNNAGGGTPLNYVDSCCLLHDRNLQGPNPTGTCTAHRNFMSCSAGRTGPGVSTIRGGIRAASFFALCGII